MSAPLQPAPPSRRTLVAVGMVGGPLLLAIGNLILPNTDGSPAAQLASIDAHRTAYLVGSIADAVGFGLLGALGVGIAMLLPRRGSTLATVAAVIALVGGAVMGAAVLVSAFVELALPATAAGVLGALQSDPGIGALFNGAFVSAIGGLLAAIALLIGRPVPVWVPILLIVGLVLSFVGGGPLGALMTIPTLVAVAVLARALIRVPAAMPTRVGDPVSA